MKNKKMILAAIALVAVLGIMAGVWFAARPKADDGIKTITVEILHKNGTVNSYTIRTEAETLAQAMNEKELLGPDVDGMYLTIDGETTDFNADQSWWKLLRNGKDPNEGANTVVIADGDVFRWEYTIGWA